MLNELVSNRLPGFYFLPQAEFMGDRTGFTALLREIRHLPSSIANRLARGLAPDEYDEFVQRGACPKDALSFSEGSLCMPVGQLPSPVLEHVGQTVANLFSRIGVPDPERGYSDELWGRQTIAQEVDE